MIGAQLPELPDKITWYVARSGGIVAWALLAASVIWGLLLSTRVLNRRATPAWLLDLHRFMGASAVVMTAVHLGGLVADNWVHIGWAQILVPMTSRYRPGAVAWGVVALYLLMAVQITSMLRNRISRRLWRATHYLSFPLFAGSTLHGLQAGKDAGLRAYQLATVTVVSLVMVLLVLRVVATTRRQRGTRTTVASSARVVARP